MISVPVIVSSPNLPGWEMFPLEKELKERLRLPVIIENDANAQPTGIHFYAGSKKNLVNITLGTGIGAELIAEGKYTGVAGLPGNRAPKRFAQRALAAAEGVDV